MLSGMAILPISCRAESRTSSSISLILKPSSFPTCRANSCIRKICSLVSLVLSARVFCREEITELRALLLSNSLFRYILSSASLRTCLIFCPVLSLTAVPREILIGIGSSPASAQKFLIRRHISQAVFSSVNGKSMANSSPPHRQIISSLRQDSFRILTAFINSLSPCLWPKASLTSLSPFRSPMIMPKGICLFVSRRFSSSSK